MNIHFLETPLAAPASGDLRKTAELQKKRTRTAGLAAALFAHGDARGNIERLLAPGALAITTGQQAGLFTGPLYSVLKALSAAALARTMAEQGMGSVVPVFWVAGDDHDFAEINNCTVIGTDNQPARIVLRERAPDAPMLPAYREPVGPEGTAALAKLEGLLPAGDARTQTMEWLSRAWTPDTNLAEAYTRAMGELLGRFGVVVARGWAGPLKSAAKGAFELASQRANEIDTALAARAGEMEAAGRQVPVEVGERMSLLMIDGVQGRDRLRITGDGFATRRGNENVSRQELARVMDIEPERLSANVLLRPVVEAAVFPTVAYFGGPGELAYLEQTDPVFAMLGIPRPARLPRLSGMLVEPKVEKILAKYQLAVADLAREPGALASQVARASLPEGALQALAQLRESVTARYAALQKEAVAIEPTLERPMENLRNQALVGSQKAEKKLVAALKKKSELAIEQVMRARGQLFPNGHPQEREISAVSFLGRHGFELLDPLFDAACAHARTLLEAPSRRT